MLKLDIPLCPTGIDFVARLDCDMNLVVRILELLIALDCPPPNLRCTNDDGGLRLSVSRLIMSAMQFEVFKRRVARLPGVRAVEV